MSDDTNEFLQRVYASGLTQTWGLRRAAMYQVEYEKRVITLRALGVPEQKAKLIIDLCLKASTTMVAADADEQLYDACCRMLRDGDSPSEVYNWIQDITL